MTTHFNNRLVTMARTAAEASEVQFNIIKNDPVEKDRANQHLEDAARLRQMATRWEQNPVADPVI